MQISDRSVCGGFCSFWNSVVTVLLDTTSARQSGRRRRQYRVRCLSLVVVVALIAVGCGSRAEEVESPIGNKANRCDPPRPHDVGKTFYTLMVNNLEREYLLFVPDGYDGSEGWPLLLAFHGSSGLASLRQSELDFRDVWNTPPSPLTTETLVVAPQGIQSKWMPGGNASRDVDFVVAILDDVTERLCVDAKRIFGEGHSGGGRMVSALACPLSDRLAAVGTATGMQDPFAPTCQPTRPVPVTSYIGDQDPAFPVEQIEEHHARWAENNGCDPTPTFEEPYPGVTLSRYESCDQGATVELYVMAGAGHQLALSDCSHIPGLIRDLFCIESDFDYRAVHQTFFEGHPMP